MSPRTSSSRRRGTGIIIIMISLSHGDEPPPARGSGGHRPGSRVQGGPGPASAAAAAVSGLHCRSQVKARRAPEFKFQRLRRPRFNVTAPSRISGAAAAGPRRLGDTLVPAIRAAKPLQRRAPRKLRRNQNLGRACGPAAATNRAITGTLTSTARRRVSAVTAIMIAGRDSSLTVPGPAAVTSLSHRASSMLFEV